ncbi:unnamed protein product [Rhizophagus irregularis]|nr:unnamed protein product [Rhizophagus irregularis]
MLPNRYECSTISLRCRKKLRNCLTYPIQRFYDRRDWDNCRIYCRRELVDRSFTDNIEEFQQLKQDFELVMKSRPSLLDGKKRYRSKTK